MSSCGPEELRLNSKVSSSKNHQELLGFSFGEAKLLPLASCGLFYFILFFILCFHLLRLLHRCPADERPNLPLHPPKPGNPAWCPRSSEDLGSQQCPACSGCFISLIPPPPLEFSWEKKRILGLGSLPCACAVLTH